MGLLRSEEMSSGMLILPAGEGGKLARDYIDALGKKTSIQFEDMNAKDMKRPYRKQIQRLEEMERILRFLHEEAARLDMPPVRSVDPVGSFLESDSLEPYVMTAEEKQLQKTYKEITQLKERDNEIIYKRDQIQEEVFVLEEATKIMAHSHSRDRGNDLTQPLTARILKAQAGVIPSDQQVRFARTIFRATRGNTFAHYSPIAEPVVDPKTGTKVQKSVFVILFQGMQDSKESALHEKVRKLCQTFGVNAYDWPDTHHDCYERLKVQKTLLEEKQKLIKSTEDHMRDEFQKLAVADQTGKGRNSKLEDLRLFLRKGEVHLCSSEHVCRNKECSSVPSELLVCHGGQRQDPGSVEVHVEGVWYKGRGCKSHAFGR
jgi:V-type H+-transporting ATPase subunit a